MSEELTSNTRIIKKINENELSNTEEKIANYIKLKPKKVLKISIRKFAEIVDVSPGSILNFCRNILNLDGFAELKIQIAEDLSKPNSTEEVYYNSFLSMRENDFNNIYKGITKDYDDEKFKQFNFIINNANNIEIYDTDDGSLSRRARSLLYKKGIRNINIIENMNFGVTRVVNMQKNDVLLVLAPGFENIEANKELIEICSSQIISIVPDRLNKISLKPDLIFYTNSTKERSYMATLEYLETLVSYLDINKN